MSVITTTLHRCLASGACRNTDVVDDVRQGALTEHANTLCPPCRSHIESAIQQLPRDWAELRNALGDRAATTGSKIRSTPTPAIPISTRKEALMAAIVDMADRAAAIVSDQLHTRQPAAYHGRGHPTRQERTLAASVAITEPNVDLLALAPPEAALVWKKPQRCDLHQHLIGSAEAMLDAEPRPREAATAREHVRRAYAAAGTCDDCNGWGQWGQERQLIEMSGLDIALELVELHNQTRAELGKTRLRHRYPMPCPRCGNRVGRDDGETIITCDDRTTCKATWTEREYQFLAGLITRERLDVEMSKYYLSEGYWRLDRVQALIESMGDDPRIDLAGAGTIILDQLRTILVEGATDGDGNYIGHLPPEKRVPGAVDRQATEQRQTTEDNWNWQNETPYRPPKPKQHKTTKPTGPPISPSSLTTLIHTDDITGGRPANLCTCNLVHAGDCP